MICIGIDPGNNGAIAAIIDGRPLLWSLTAETVRIDAFDALREIQVLHGKDEPLIVCLEKVGSMPKQGVSSTFKFGVAYGILQGMCVAMGFGIHYEPTPQVWKKAVFGGLHKGMSREEQKQYAREKARLLYPGIADQLKLKKDADKAEALLLAHYARELSRR
jgi:hypothetical protein